MIQESLHNSNRQDETRVRRAFGWVVTFRDFPVGSYQIVRGAEMMTEAVTMFTRGRAEFYLNGERRGDRLPGILSSEHEPLGLDGEFKLVYVEPTTRVCIPAEINNGKLPFVSKIVLNAGESIELRVGSRFLVCLGEVSVSDRTFVEEQTFTIVNVPKTLTANTDSILLNFSK